MRSIIVVALICVGMASAAVMFRDQAQYQKAFTTFAMTYNKQYSSPAEFFNRFNIYVEKLDSIATWNARNESWTQGENEFSDLTWEEFKAEYTGAAIEDTSSLPVFESDAPASPNVVDWRTKGGVTGIKNQGSCGSCWAFAATGAIETYNFVKAGKLTALSDQQTLDCSNAGSCSGGYPSQAISWGCKAQLCAGSEYAYTGRKGTCRSCTKVSKTCGGAKSAGGEGAYDNTLNAGALSITVSIGSGFQSYKTGTFSGPCGSGGHAMVLVAHDSKGWAIKNSWGGSWGMSGYSYWATGKNLCGVGSGGTIPA